jgi:Spy/CpxP family protein refolding chaperone
MNRSLKLLAALSLSALVFAAPVRADDKPAPVDGGGKPGKKDRGARQGGPADHLQIVADQLNLTADQKKDAAPIIQETHDAITKIQSDASIEQKDKKPKFQEAYKSGLDKLTALLTPEQKEQLHKIQEENKAKREGGARKGGDGAAKKGGGDAK